MIPTIETLEKEIEQFHANVSGSNALMAALNDVVSVGKKQSQLFDEKTTELHTLLGKLPEDVRTEFAICFRTFSDEIQAEHTRYQTEIAAILEACRKSVSDAEVKITATPGAVETKMSEAYARSQEAMTASQKKYADDLQAATMEFVNKTNSCMSLLEEKYASFIAKLEATNVDQIYRICEKMNSSINMKLNIALAGVAVAVILSIVGLFI